MSENANINESIYNEQKVWGLQGNEDYFINHRSQVDHLYRSEKFFLPDVLNNVHNCLDVGCACGDFSAIFKHYNPKIQYTGVDIIERFIHIARQRHPESHFEVADGTQLHFSDNSFELVHSSGILHLNSSYKDIVREMYRTSSRYILCDFRLTDGPEVVGQMDVNLIGQEDKIQRLPYYVVNIMEHLDFLKSLKPQPVSIQVKGYSHAPSHNAHLALDKIYMAFFLIIKGPRQQGTCEVDINLDS